MRKLYLLIGIFCFVFAMQAQVIDELVGGNCTSIMVGKMASADGSVITSHTCDAMYRTWVTMEPSANHKPGTMHKVYKGSMHTACPKDTSGLKLVGEIPEAAHTYAYMNTAYPCMNEKQLAMGESTFSGPDTLVNSKGMFPIEELQRIALQRCEHARDAILLIGKLIAEYGYGDGGECITIADKNEVWQMEIMGEGPDKIGGIWAAQRIPDNQVAVSCNIARITTLRRNDSANFLCSDNIEEVARKYGLWDGKGEFIWWRTFASDYGDGKNHTEREWYIFDRLAPSLHLDPEAEELPFSIVPEEKVSVHKVMELFRANFEGCDELDQIKNLKCEIRHYNNEGKIVTDTMVCPNANPWMDGNERALYNALKPGSVTFHRGVAMSWCSYSTIIQCRDQLPDAIGGICWFSFENPGQSPRIPIFAGSTQMPEGFELCGHHGFNEKAALWQYRKANKLAQVRWGSTKRLMMNNILKFEDKASLELPDLEKNTVALIQKHKVKKVQKMLNEYSAKFAEKTRHAWQEMEHLFWEHFWTGF